MKLNRNDQNEFDRLDVSWNSKLIGMHCSSVTRNYIEPWIASRILSIHTGMTKFRRYKIGF